MKFQSTAVLVTQPTETEKPASLNFHVTERHSSIDSEDWKLPKVEEVPASPEDRTSNMTCPHAQQESFIKASCPVLTSTGCTPEFCASGRMIRPLEPRVGENRPIAEIKTEAEAFLREMCEHGLLTTQQLEHRLQAVLTEIEAGAVDAAVWVDSTTDVGEMDRVKVDGVSSNGWAQTRDELEWGVRVAWRNSRKCIMRAHFGDLRLVDLRQVTTSRGILDAVIENIHAVYNGGRILPSG
ncbi:Nitric oxide synthase oxygenase [Lachnellula suecica]|uniref:nitric-oxide synthase (NADPH) n=1 Tax=Lachnellula suecica TaxID=602035 RepID=A0A8T9CCE9_9HELO|nr:Nitric oxide synthase oxygenase [Lachnellula suecica]